MADKPKWWKCPDCKETPGKILIRGVGFEICKTCTGKSKVYWLKGDSKGYGWSKN